MVVNLLELLEDVFRDAPSDGSANDCNEAHDAGRIWEPDTSRLKYLLLALIENGQRHDYHEYGLPRFGVHACARKGKNSDGKERKGKERKGKERKGKERKGK